MTENELNIPSRWDTIVLGELADDITTGFPCGDHNTEQRGVPHLRPMNINEKGEIDLSEVKYVEEENYDNLTEGDILFNNTNSPELVGKTTYINKSTDWGFSNHMTRIRIDSAICDPVWVSYYLHYLFKKGFFRKKCKNYVNQANVNKSLLVSGISIPVPPREEQNTIVSKIEELLTQIEAGKNSLNELDKRLSEYRKSTLDFAVTGGLTSEWRDSQSSIESGSQVLEDVLAFRRKRWDEKFQEIFKYSGKEYEEPEGPEVEDLLELPKSWTWSSINQLGYVMGGLTKNKDKRSSYPHEVPYLRVANVYANQLELDEIKTINIKDRERKTKILDEGDLLIVEGNGSKSQIGRVALWDGSIEPCSHQNHLIRVKILSEELRKFVLYWLLSVRGRNHIMEVASSSSGLYTLSLTKVRKIPVPLPPLREAQLIIDKIEQRISIQEQIDNTVENEEQRGNMLRYSILKKSFQGKLIEEMIETSSEGSSTIVDEGTPKQATLQEIIEGEEHD